MTAEPPWVKAALDVLSGARDNPTSSADYPPPTSSVDLADKSGLSAPSFPDVLRKNVLGEYSLDMSTLVYTTTSKENLGFAFGPLTSLYHRYPAFRKGTTCPQCPQPLWGFPEAFGYLKRCTSCNTRATRFRRAIARGDRIDNAQRHLKKSTRWVTLTVPNYDDPLEGLAHMKKLYRNFRQQKEFKQRVAGTLDFWEWTMHRTYHSLPPQWMWGGDDVQSEAHHHDKEYNVHYHGLWVGDYWKHSKLLDCWRHGGARISAVGSRRKRLNYCISYAKKQDMLGIRSQQLTGCLYGRVYVEIESALRRAEELSNAGGAHGSTEPGKRGSQE